MSDVGGGGGRTRIGTLHQRRHPHRPLGLAKISCSACYVGIVAVASAVTRTSSFSAVSQSSIEMRRAEGCALGASLNAPQETPSLRNVMAFSGRGKAVRIPMLSVAFSSRSDTEIEKRRRDRSPKPDDEDWTTLIAAFQMYKAAYGDLKVPSRFVVPTMPPWPESAWGMKLGQRVAEIRSTGKYVKDNDSRRKALDNMGFLWRLRAPSPDKKMDVTFDQIFDALATYRKEIQPEGPLNVPANFIVPNYSPWPEITRGMPLGKKIPTVRSKAYLKANPGAVEMLNNIGFEFDGKAAINDARYSKVYEALVRYKEMYGDLLVPQPFVVPENTSQWPEETWGLRLGARVNAIRSQGTFTKNNPERKEELDALGFEWELIPDNGKKRGRKKKHENEALSGLAPPGLLDLEEEEDDEDYSEADDTLSDSLFGSSSKLGNDIFSFEDEKQASLWGFEDDGDDQPTQEAMQQTKEFEYDPPKDLASTLKRAGDMAMSVGIIEETTSEGRKRVRKGKITKYVPWFNDDFGDSFIFEDVVEALATYKAMHGSLAGLDDKEFVVPDPSDPFDVEASAGAAAAIAEAEHDGADSDELIAAEIERMQETMRSGQMGVNVDGSNLCWPEHLSGMKLSALVKRIRDGSLEVKHIAERKTQLDALGFDWGDPKFFIDVAFDKAMCAMYAYYLVRGDMFVYEDFVMPSEEPWPTVLGGYELGKTVKRIRELQNFFEAYHPDKVRMLRMIEFVWFPELALPLNPEKGDETFDEMYVEALGHPFYSYIEDPPAVLVEKLQAEGPWGPEEKLTSWYNYDIVKDYLPDFSHIKPMDPEDPNPEVEAEHPYYTWRTEWFRDKGFEPDDPVAIKLRRMGFHQLATEHEQKYNPTSFAAMFSSMMTNLMDGKLTDAELENMAAPLLTTLKEFKKQRSEWAERSGFLDDEFDALRVPTAPIDTNTAIMSKEEDVEDNMEDDFDEEEDELLIEEEEDEEIFDEEEGEEEDENEPNLEEEDDFGIEDEEL